MSYTSDRDRQASYQAELAAGLARRLRDTRIDAGLSTAALARQAGLGRTLILLAEAGKGGGVGLAAVAALADTLGVRRAWLGFGEGPRDP